MQFELSFCQSQVEHAHCGCSQGTAQRPSQGRRWWGQVKGQAVPKAGPAARSVWDSVPIHRFSSAERWSCTGPGTLWAAGPGPHGSSAFGPHVGSACGPSRTRRRSQLAPSCRAMLVVVERTLRTVLPWPPWCSGRALAPLPHPPSVRCLGVSVSLTQDASVICCHTTSHLMASNNIYFVHYPCWA